jgi:hypothetical protein
MDCHIAERKGFAQGFAQAYNRLAGMYHIMLCHPCFHIAAVLAMLMTCRFMPVEDASGH